MTKLLLIALFLVATPAFAGKVLKSKPKNGLYVVELDDKDDRSLRKGDRVTIRGNKTKGLVKATVISSNSRQVKLKVKPGKTIAAKGEKLVIKKQAKKPENVVDIQTTVYQPNKFSGYYLKWISASSLTTSIFGARYEAGGAIGMSLGKSFSIGAFGSYGIYDGEILEITSMTGGADLAFYFSGVFKHSFYIEASPYYSQYNVAFNFFEESYELSHDLFGGNLFLGYQLIWDNGIMISFGLGPQLNYILIPEDTTEEEEEALKERAPLFWVGSKLSIGYMF